MRRVDLALLGGLVLLTAAGAPAAEEPLLRYRAPIAVERSAAFVQLPLPVAAYRHSLQPSDAARRPEHI